MPLDRCLLVTKVGDNRKHKDGMPVCFIDEAVWGRPLEEIISPNMARVYGCFQVNPSFRNIFHDMLEPVYDQEDIRELKPIKHAKKVYTKYTDIEKKLGIPGLEAKLRSQTESTGIINGTELVLSDFMDVRTGLPADPIEDLNTISSGAYTIGTGGDYATIVAFDTDVVNLTGNLTGTIISALSETASVDTNFNTGAYTYTVRGDTDPKGYQGGGRLITWDAGNVNNWWLSTIAGTVELYYLNIKATASAFQRMFVPYYGAGTVTIRDSLIDIQNASNVPAINIYSTPQVMNVFNVNFFASGTATSFLAINTSVAGVITMENCTCYKGRIDAGNIATWRLNNNISIVPTAVAAYANTSIAVFSKCASIDATGSETALQQVGRDVFRSIDPANANFLRLNMVCPIQNLGTTPLIAANNHDIRGATRPRTGSLVSIGSDEGQDYIYISGISPNCGLSTGGTTVTITVPNGMTGATGATIGGAACTSFTVLSDTQCSFVTPSGTDGTSANVVVTLLDASTITLTNGYKYSDKIYSALDELTRNTFTSVADLRLNVGITIHGDELTGTCAVPPVHDVRSGIAVDNTVGTCVVPSYLDVRAGTSVGSGFGACAIPAASEVREGTAVDNTTGTCEVPNDEDVRFGVLVDNTTGLCVVPTPANVKLGIEVDSYGELGTYSPSLPIPDAPTSVVATKVSSTAITVRWAYTANSATYNVYRSTSLDGTYSLLVAGTSLTVLSLTDTTCSASTTYYYKIKASNTIPTASGFSEAAYATTDATSTPEASSTILNGNFSIIIGVGDIIATCNIVTFSNLTISIEVSGSVYTLRYNDGTNNKTQALAYTGSGFALLCIVRSGTSLIVMEEGVAFASQALSSVVTHSGNFYIMNNQIGTLSELRIYNSALTEAQFYYYYYAIRTLSGKTVLIG